MILRQPRFTRLMDDPKLIQMLEELEPLLKTHQAALREAGTQVANAS